MSNATKARPRHVLRLRTVATLLLTGVLSSVPMQGDAYAQYLLAGSADGTGSIQVDDTLVVYLNGAIVYSHTGGAGARPPIAIAGTIGDVVRLSLRDSSGPCAALSRVYLIDPQGRSTLVTQGFDGGCSNPLGNNGTVYDVSHVIEGLDADVPAYRELTLPGSTLAGVIRGPGGYLYGVTYSGGAHGKGTLFAVSPDLSTVTVLHDFTGGVDGGMPYDGLTLRDNVLFGTTTSGGTAGGGGTVFRFNVSGSALTTLRSFGFGEPYEPRGPLVVVGDRVYGTAARWPGGVFRMNTDGTGFGWLHLFSGHDGIFPRALTLGPIALQLAKQHGLEVTGVDSADKLPKLQAMDCDHVIDYRSQDFTRAGIGDDVILDVKTQRSPADFTRALNPNGTYVTSGVRWAG